MILIVSQSVFAEKFVSEIKPLTGEKWYGAYTAKAFCGTPLKNLTFQPYQANEKKKDLRTDNRANQAAPLLISNLGRYVWSDQPFAFELKDGCLIIYSDLEKVEAVAVGKTLRDAYMGAMKVNFPASGKTPELLMFKMTKCNVGNEFKHDPEQTKIRTK